MRGCFGGGELGTHRTHLVVKRATEEAEVGFGELVERRGVGFEAMEVLQESWRWPERRQEAQIKGSRQSLTWWSRPRQRKQRFSILSFLFCRKDW